jgi:hypothetical protein
VRGDAGRADVSSTKRTKNTKDTKKFFCLSGLSVLGGLCVVTVIRDTPRNQLFPKQYSALLVRM